MNLCFKFLLPWSRLFTGKNPTRLVSVPLISTINSMSVEIPLDPVCDPILKAYVENNACSHGWEW